MRRIDKDQLRNLQSTGGALCFLSGVCAVLLAGLLSVVLWITGADIHPRVRLADSILFFVAIPLILVAGYCLDWSERKTGNHAEQRTPER